MSTFCSYGKDLHDILFKIVQADDLHAKWVNTLSYLENCGARKIASCEHPTLVKEEMLKHASEEFRHAHYLKKQLIRVMPIPFHDYSMGSLIGGFGSLHYLDALEVKICRYLLKDCFLKEAQVKEFAYLLVTYAIELRAEELYRIYDAILRQFQSKITVKSIILEEKEHLFEMEKGICQIENGHTFANKVLEIEGKLCRKWLSSIALYAFRGG